MVDPKTIKPNDPVIIIDGTYSGRLAWFQHMYPYPDGDIQCIISLADESDYKLRRVSTTIDRIVKVQNLNKLIATKDITPPNDPKVFSDFKMNERVIIAKDGEWYGHIGNIRAIIPVTGGCLIDYEVEPVHQPEGKPRINLRVHERDLVPTNYNKIMVKGFDVGRYLDPNLMITIATEEYEKAVREHLKEVIDKRSHFGEMGLTDYIVYEVAKIYAQELAPQYKDVFLQKIKDEIQITVDPTKSTDAQGNCVLPFETIFTSAIGKVAEQWAESHIEEIAPYIKESVVAAAKKVSTDRFAYIIRKQFNVYTFVDDLVKDLTKDLKKETEETTE